jgi:hypothetical protein
MNEQVDLKQLHKEIMEELESFKKFIKEELHEENNSTKTTTIIDCKLLVTDVFEKYAPGTKWDMCIDE